MSEARSIAAPLDRFSKRVTAAVIRPGDAEYDRARRVWNGMIDRRPALIVRCADVDDVVACVEFARDHGLPIAVRGGAHSVAGHGTCDDGIVIDLSPMRAVKVDADRQRASVQAGATWGVFDAAAQTHGLAVTGGIMSETGVAGLTLGGGIGWLMRKHGLSADNLLGADVVTADARRLTASADENADLFWGLQRGGGNFGIVTELRFRLHPVGPIVLAGWALFPQEKTAEVLRFHRDFAARAPDELTTIVILRRLPQLPSVPPFLRGVPVIGVAVCHCGVIEDGERAVQPLRAFGPPLVDGIALKPYVAHQTMFDAAQPAGRHNYWKTAYLAGLGDGAIDAIVEGARRMTSPLSVVALYQLGGAAKLGGAAFCLNAAATWTEPAENERHIGWARDFANGLEAHSCPGAYVNFLGDEDEDRVGAAYRETFARLVALKTQFDPENVFRLNQNIKPTTR
jgi:hypothetical protein